MSLEEPNNFIEWYVIRNHMKILIKQTIIDLYKIDKNLLNITNNILIHINKTYNLNISFIYFIGQYKAYIEDIMTEIMYMEIYNKK